MLPSFIRPATPPALSSRPPSPTSIFAAHAANLFLDEERCSHGHAGGAVFYDAAHLGDIRLGLPDTAGAASEQGLYAHFVWNAAVLLAELIGGAGRLRREAARRRAERAASSSLLSNDDALEAAFWARNWDVTGTSVIELGAGVFSPLTSQPAASCPTNSCIGLGTALPSLVAARVGAARVVATDYPAPELLRVLQVNATSNRSAAAEPTVAIHAHEWGEIRDAGFAQANKNAFARVLLADVLWLPAQHAALRRSVQHFLAPGGRAWVAAGFHTGRATVADFLAGSGDGGLCLEVAWEVDVNGRVRRWEADRTEEGVGEARRWGIVAILKRADDGDEAAGKASDASNQVQSQDSGP